MKSSVRIPASLRALPLSAPPRPVSVALRYMTLGGSGSLAVLSGGVTLAVLGTVPFYWVLAGLGLFVPEAIHDYREGRRALHLLVHGVFGAGRHVDTSPERPVPWWKWGSHGRDPIYDHTFELTTADGARVRVTASDGRVRGVDEDRPEMVLYDPGDPDQGFLLHALPGSPRLSPDGQFFCPTSRVLTELGMAVLAVLVAFVIDVAL